MVLCGRAQHRGAANIDLLDRVLKEHVGIVDGLTERIEIDGYQVDRDDAVFLKRLHVGGQVAPGEESAVNRRMQRLYPSVQHLRKTGDFFDPCYRQARLFEGSRRAARRHDLPSELGQPFGQFLDSLFVGYRNQCARHVSPHFVVRLMSKRPCWSPPAHRPLKTRLEETAAGPLFRCGPRPGPRLAVVDVRLRAPSPQAFPAYRLS